MRKAGTRSTIAALAVTAACFCFVSGLRADQSPQDASSILTTGWWHAVGETKFHFHGTIFKPDGTFIFGDVRGTVFTNRKEYDGTWQIVEEAVVLTYPGGKQEKYFLPLDPDGTHGADVSGKPMVMTRKSSELTIQDSGNAANAQPSAADTAANPTPTPPIAPEEQQSASQIIQAYHNSLVFVTGAEGSGSGFITTIAGANYLVTNVHVTAGIHNAEFKTLDGTVVQGGVASMAVGEDIFCMALPPGGKPLEIMQEVDANAAIGDAVVVLGNAEGQGVVNTIIGKIVGIGPNLVEIDAPFVPGNSGSPIIHLKSGKVIGVATYTVTNQYDLTTDQKLKQPIVRRFGYRLDSVKKWQAVNWPAFEAQDAQMESIDALTDDLYDFLQDLDKNKGAVTMGRHTNPVIKKRIDDWLAEKGSHPSADDAAEADTNFISSLKEACQSDVAAAQGRITYDYFVRDLADQKQSRDEMAKDFQQIIQGLGQ
jgi:S1-C subfamily serine protease